MNDSKIQKSIGWFGVCGILAISIVFIINRIENPNLTETELFLANIKMLVALFVFMCMVFIGNKGYRD